MVKSAYNNSFVENLDNLLDNLLDINFILLNYLSSH